MVLSREITNILNTGLDIYNCIICLFMFFSLLDSAKSNKANKYFAVVCLCCFIFNFSDISNWCFEGNSPAWKIPLLHIFTFIFYAVPPFIFIFLIKYTETYLQASNSNSICFKICIGISICYLLGTIITPFTGFYYYITPDNFYTRGKFNFVSYVFYAGFYLLSTIVIIRNKNYFTHKEFITFLTFPLLPIVCESLQLLFYGLALVNIGMTLSILLIFLNLHINLENDFINKAQEAQSTQKKLINFQEHTIISLSNLVENRDTETGEHARRTSLFVELLARRTMKDGFYTDIITESYIKNLVKAAPMHDIGKIVVSDNVLKKPGRLDDNEFEEMKHHAQEGGRIVNDIIGLTDDKEYIQIAIDMAQSHHERWDGNGYPNRLKGNSIPLCARLMAVADVFDALVFERCYKKPIPPEEAFSIIENESGSHFDPILIQEFFKIKEEILRIMHIYQD